MSRSVSVQFCPQGVMLGVQRDPCPEETTWRICNVYVLLYNFGKSLQVMCDQFDAIPMIYFIFVNKKKSSNLKTKKEPACSQHYIV